MKLSERPTRRGRSVDITCDSDGQVNKFIDPARCPLTRLQLHKLVRKTATSQIEPYYIGFFLMGAPTQDIMGDLHNLFCRVNESACVSRSRRTRRLRYVEEINEGTTIAQALASVQYDENELKRLMKAQIDDAIKSDRMKPSEAMRLLDDYERGLKDYTRVSYVLGACAAVHGDQYRIESRASNF